MNKAAPVVGSSWTRQQIEDVLNSEPYNYQAIALPHGLSTGGHDRSGTARVILPEDMSGQSFIDIGCSLGYFCFEARRRGADRVVGLDFDPDNVRKGKTLADILGLPVEFRTGDIDHAPIAEKFDQVICLNVLHHLANPVLGLDRLVAATKQKLVLELATFGAHDRRKLGMSWLEERFLSRSPSILVGRGTSGEGVKQFYITKSAIENLLRYRRGCFASVEILPSTFKERFLVIATMRQIDDLSIIGFPTSSAVSQIAQKIAGRAIPQAAQFLRLAGPAPVLLAEDYHKPQPSPQKELIFQYDFMRPVTEAAGTLDHDPALDVLDTARRAQAVTIWLPREELKAGLQRDIQAAAGRSRKRLKSLLGLYDDPKRLVQHYNAWFQYLSRKNIDQRVLRMSESGSELLTVEEWQRDIAGPLLQK